MATTKEPVATKRNWLMTPIPSWASVLVAGVATASATAFAVVAIWASDDPESSAAFVAAMVAMLELAALFIVRRNEKTATPILEWIAIGLLAAVAGVSLEALGHDWDTRTVTVFICGGLFASVAARVVEHARSRRDRGVAS